MGQTPINFFTEDLNFTLKQKGLIRTWIKDTIVAENHRLRVLNLIFCSDDYLLTINQQYLDHDTYTDIITFDNSENKLEIKGDIFISIDQIRENAKKLNIAEKDELHRVIIHGTLHLLSYSDKGKSSKEIMTQKEDFYLSKRTF